MKFIRLICIVCVAFVSVEGFAQGKINRPTKKGQQQSSSTTKSPNGKRPQVQEQSIQQVQQLQQPPKPTTGVINGHEWVDLGLPSRLKWATCNVGAYSPSGNGSYYAWGETTTKFEYTDANSKIANRALGDISGNAQYDVAHVKWGGSWRLPTKAEMQELINKCKWIWTTQRDHKGYEVTGPNGNSIFLPAAGWYSKSILGGAGYDGHYWLSASDANNIKFAYYLDFNSGSYYIDCFHRYMGRSIRAVSY